MKTAKPAASIACILPLLIAPPIICADPIVTRDQNPFLTGFGIPLPFPARLSDRPRSEVQLTMDWSNSGTIQLADGEELVADVETRALNALLLHRFENGLAVRVRVPWIYRGAGILDSFIEDWHDALGMPQGSRRRLPRDAVLIGYARDEEILYLRDSGGDGIGDIAFDAGMTLHESDAAAAAIWLTVKLPTGDEADLLGSGAVDAGLALAGDLRLSERWSLYGQVAYTYLGRGEFLPDLQRDYVVSGLFGIAWRVAEPLTLKAQVDAHTAVFEATAIDFLDEATILTVGVDFEPAERWQLSFAVGEDIEIRTSPDVVFHFSARRGF
ncbi:MAG TPA: DUF3187 family protein [Steroidobacteraceae bacterium]|nr:DUF3187 family protein [Steroidobacteraceae bacterium]